MTCAFTQHGAGAMLAVVSSYGFGYVHFNASCRASIASGISNFFKKKEKPKVGEPAEVAKPHETSPVPPARPTSAPKPRGGSIKETQDIPEEEQKNEPETGTGNGAGLTRSFIT